MRLICIAATIVAVASAGKFCLNREDSQRQLWEAAKAEVLRRLPAPSTAVFPEVDVAKVWGCGSANEQVFVVESDVDAQNVYGAMIRWEWAAQVAREGETCRVIDVLIEPWNQSLTSEPSQSTVKKR